MIPPGLSVRTQNVLSARGLKSADDVRALSDGELIQNCGPSTMRELRAAGLRPNSCVAGCVLAIGHTGDHVMHDSPYASAVPWNGELAGIGPTPPANVDQLQREVLKLRAELAEARATIARARSGATHLLRILDQ